MSMKPKTSATVAQLRRRAEVRLRKQRKRKKCQVRGQRSAAETQRLVHELEVHQVELEMQNVELRRANVQAVAAAEKFSALYDFAPIGYVTLDDGGRIRDLNFTAAKLLGRPRVALTGTLLVRGVAARDRESFLRHLRAASDTDAKVTGEVELCSETGHSVPVQICTTCRRDEPGETRQYLTAITDITERKQAEGEVRKLNAELEERILNRTATIRRLATELTLAEQREKTQLAQVLHDHVQQLLVAARSHLGAARQHSTSRQRKMLDQAEQILMQSMGVVRTLSVELSPPVLRGEGLTVALTWLGGWMREKHGLAVKLTSKSTQAPLATEISLLLYHAVRELLFNIVKHAQVKSASVAVDWLEDEVRIVVSDKGMDFDPVRLLTAAASAEKFGLFTVRERLALWGGQVEIASAPGRGSRFTLRVPLGRPIAPRTRGKTPVVL